MKFNINFGVAYIIVGATAVIAQGLGVFATPLWYAAAVFSVLTSMFLVFFFGAGTVMLLQYGKPTINKTDKKTRNYVDPLLIVAIHIVLGQYILLAILATLWLITLATAKMIVQHAARG